MNDFFADAARESGADVPLEKPFTAEELFRGDRWVPRSSGV